MRRRDRGHRRVRLDQRLRVVVNVDHIVVVQIVVVAGTAVSKEAEPVRGTRDSRLTGLR